MAGNAECQIGTEGVADNEMKKGNWRLVLLECDCSVRLIQEPRMEDNPLVQCSDVVNTWCCGNQVHDPDLRKSLFFNYRKMMGTLCNNSNYSF